MKPLWNPAPFVKPLALILGPGGMTVRLNTCGVNVLPLTVAVTVTDPGFAPAVTEIWACPWASVVALVALSVALPEVSAKLTVTP